MVHRNMSQSEADTRILYTDPVHHVLSRTDRYHAWTDETLPPQSVSNGAPYGGHCCHVIVDLCSVCKYILDSCKI